MINDSLAATVITILIAMYLLVGVVVYALYRFGADRSRPFRLDRGSKIGIALVTTAFFGMMVIGWVNWPSGTKKAMAIKTELTSVQLQEMGKSLFNVHCVMCHGEDGKAPGGKGADLTHRISFESALLNIQRGGQNFRTAFPGGMPPMVANEHRAAQIAHYVSSGFTENEEGKMLYEMIKCARCHNDDGRGKKRLGPNIREFDEQTITLVLRNGKNGVIGKMPRFDHFSDLQIKALAHYVLTFQK